MRFLVFTAEFIKLFGFAHRIMFKCSDFSEKYTVSIFRMNDVFK